MWGLHAARAHRRRLLPRPAVVRAGPLVTPEATLLRRRAEVGEPPAPLTRRIRLPHSIAPAVSHAPAPKPPAARLEPRVSAPRAHRLWTLPVPRVHRRAPRDLVALDHPTAFRGAFARPLGPPFLAQATPERELLAVLTATSLREARTHAARFEASAWLAGGARRAAEPILAEALGRRPLAGPWGEHRTHDALRVRLLAAAHHEEDAAPALGWGAFLRWAAPRVLDIPVGEALVPVAATAVACGEGYARAFTFASARFRRGPQLDAFPFMSALALRAAMAGAFRPDMVAWLVPWGRLRAPSHGGDPWTPALLALRAYREGGVSGGLVHLTAALVAAEVRRLVAGPYERAGSPWLRRWWSGDPPPPAAVIATAARHLRDEAVRAHRRHAAATAWKPRWGGPGPGRVLDRVWALLGSDGDHTYELFLDDRLAVAAVFASHGYAPSAHVLLAGLDPPAPLAPAAAALRAALDRAPALPVEVDGPAGARELDRLFEKLARTPDPSVALASPWWRVVDARGPLLSRLMAEGRVDEARAVKTLLGRRDLMDELRPFWLLQGTVEDDAALDELAARLAARERPRPDLRDWLRFLEDRCRRADHRSGG